MADNNVTTSITVQFGTPETQANLLGEGYTSIQVEVDGRENGLNEGKTSQFGSGEEAFLLVYTPDNVTFDTYISAGSLSYVSKGFIELEEFVTFIDGEGSVSKVPASLVSVTWVGLSNGSLTKEGTALKCTGSNKTAVAKVKYRTKVRIYKISGVTSTIFLDGEAQISAVFVATAV
jgi:hypothetical protein